MRSPFKRILAIVAERLLTAGAGIVVRERAPQSVPRRILVVRCDHIGDAVMCTPALRRLRDAFPSAQLDVLAGPWAAEAFPPSLATETLVYATPWWCAARGMPLRDRLTAWARLPGTIRRLRARKYDLAVDLRGDLRQSLCFLALGQAALRVSSDRTGGTALLSAWWHHDARLHEVEKGLAIAGSAIAAVHGARGAIAMARESREEWPLEAAPQPVSAAVAALVERAGGPHGYVALAIRGNASAKAWPGEHAVAMAAGLRDELGLGTVYIGGASDVATGQWITEQSGGAVQSAAGRCGVRETLSLCAGAACVVTVDSGPMHLATASGAPVVALFGPTDPELYAPWTPRHRVLGPMAPCGCTGATCSRAGSAQPSPCMMTISAASVCAAVREMIAAAEPSLPGTTHA